MFLAAVLSLTVVSHTACASLMDLRSQQDWENFAVSVESSTFASFKTHKDGLKYFEKYSQTLLSGHPLRDGSAPLIETEYYNVTDVPESYDIRSIYPRCSSPKTVVDQGSCGGCWAISTASSLSDRLCMADPQSSLVLSPQDLLDCVEGESKGCNGGFTEDGFDYVSDEGIRDIDCVPFTASDGFCSTDDSCKKYYSSIYSYISSDEEKIKAEILENGSVSAVFEVFADFFVYESGVYNHVDGDYAGLHAVTLTGWGTLDGVDHWIVRNSWGTDFGYNGYFYIARGLDNNGCNFEGGLTAAKMKV